MTVVQRVTSILCLDYPEFWVRSKLNTKIQYLTKQTLNINTEEVFFRNHTNTFKLNSVSNWQACIVERPKVTKHKHTGYKRWVCCKRWLRYRIIPKAVKWWKRTEKHRPRIWRRHDETRAQTCKTAESFAVRPVPISVIDRIIPAYGKCTLKLYRPLQTCLGSVSWDLLDCYLPKPPPIVP